MTRWVLGGSYLLLNFALIDLIWGNGLLSHTAGVAIVVVIVAGWFFTAYFLLRHLQLTMRGKIVGWLFIVVFSGYTVARRFGSYYLYHGAWLRWVESDAVGLLLVLASFALAALILPKSAPTVTTPLTVESEAPDHVLHLDKYT